MGLLRVKNTAMVNSPISPTEAPTKLTLLRREIRFLATKFIGSSTGRSFGALKGLNDVVRFRSIACLTYFWCSRKYRNIHTPEYCFRSGQVKSTNRRPISVSAGAARMVLGLRQFTERRVRAASASVFSLSSERRRGSCCCCERRKVSNGRSASVWVGVLGPYERWCSASVLVAALNSMNVGER